MLDFVIITETKLYNTFPASQFHIDGYFKPCRLDRNRNGVVEKTYVRECLTIYVRENITKRMLTKCNFVDNMEDLFIELSTRKRKWLLSGMYHPPSQPD